MHLCRNWLISFEENYPDLKGFNRRGLYRMKQFYELYKDNEKVSTLFDTNWKLVKPI